MRCGGAADGFGADLGQADVADVPGFHHVGDRTDGVLDRHVRIEAGGTVDVDVVQTKPLQGIGEKGLHGRGAGVVADPAAGRIAQGAELDADLGAIPGNALQGLADQHFVVAHAVEVAGVEQADAGVEGGVDRGDALRTFERAIHAGHAHAAEAEGGHVRTGGAELTVFHGRSFAVNATGLL